MESRFITLPPHSSHCLRAPRKQAFFVARIYRATGALYISIFLWIVVAFLQGVSLKLAAEAIRTDSIPIVGQTQTWLITLLFFGDATLDIINACVLCFYLKVKSRSAFSQRLFIINHSSVKLYSLRSSFVALRSFSIVWLSTRFVSNFVRLWRHDAHKFDLETGLGTRYFVYNVRLDSG